MSIAELPDTCEPIERLLAKRIVVLDGAMGTMIQQHKFDESHFRGDRFADHSQPLSGCNDLLSLTQPAVIEEIHGQFLAAGADIIETNTFTSTSISLADYGLESEVRAINLAAARCARNAVEKFCKQTGDTS